MYMAKHKIVKKTIYHFLLRHLTMVLYKKKNYELDKFCIFKNQTINGNIKKNNNNNKLLIMLFYYKNI